MEKLKLLIEGCFTQVQKSRIVRMTKKVSKITSRTSKPMPMVGITWALNNLPKMTRETLKNEEHDGTQCQHVNTKSTFPTLEQNIC